MRLRRAEYQRSVVGRIEKVVKNVGPVDVATQGKIADQQKKNVGDQRWSNLQSTPAVVIYGDGLA